MSSFQCLDLGNILNRTEDGASKPLFSIHYPDIKSLRGVFLTVSDFADIFCDFPFIFLCCLESGCDIAGTFD